MTVTINYRLGTYGFLAVPGHLNGNYGLGDQATALQVSLVQLTRSKLIYRQWVVDNIAQFGGDPKVG